jgi:hypothetical protein
MIFTPCKDGLSHNEAESIRLEDVEAGTQMLLNTVLARANRALKLASGLGGQDRCGFRSLGRGRRLIDICMSASPALDVSAPSSEI